MPGTPKAGEAVGSGEVLDWFHTGRILHDVCKSKPLGTNGSTISPSSFQRMLASLTAQRRWSWEPLFCLLPVYLMCNFPRCATLLPLHSSRSHRWLAVFQPAACALSSWPASSTSTLPLLSYPFCEICNVLHLECPPFNPNHHRHLFPSWEPWSTLATKVSV